MSSLMFDGHFFCCSFNLLVLADFELSEALMSRDGIAREGNSALRYGQHSC